MVVKRNPETEERDYEVGFAKPPVNTQFVKGQSGNPHGRPRGKRNIATMLNAALNETVIVNENGERKKITKLEAVFKQVVNKAAGGDLASVKVLTPLLPMLGALQDEEGAKHTSSEADKQVLLNLQKLLLARADKAALITKTDNNASGEKS
jgi:hypothetical protein